MYFRIDDGSKLGGIIAAPFKNIVSLIYENTQFLNVLWDYSPLPDHMNFSDINNVYFLFTYAVLFIGAALMASGRKLSRRISKIKEQIEDQIIKESLSGNIARSRQEIEDAVEIPNSSIFTQFQQLYIAPIITGVIATLIVKIFTV